MAKLKSSDKSLAERDGDNAKSAADSQPAPRQASKPAARSAGNAKPPGIAAIRVKIDQIDRELVALINERAKLAHQIGQIKETTGCEAYDPAREEEVLNRVAMLNEGPLDDCSLRAIFRELISGSRALEKQLRVAYLGPAYSYTHLAAIHRFGQSVELIPVGTIAAVFEEINRGHAHYGVAPIE